MDPRLEPGAPRSQVLGNAGHPTERGTPVAPQITAPPRRAAEVLFWAGILTASLLLESLPAAHRVDLRLATAWSHAPTPERLPDVWAAGLPLPAAAAFVVTSWAASAAWRERWAAWSLFLVAGSLEIVFKHLGAGRSGLDAGIYLVQNPAGVLGMVQHTLTIAAARVHLEGAFPSGHVVRLTLIAGYLLPVPHRWLAVTVGLLGCLAGAAVGGHTLAEGIGGLALSMAGLAFLRRT